MRKHPVRKFFTLLVVYAAIIVGIFVLQFKSESIISKSIGPLRISYAQTESSDNVTTLRNQFKASFKGLNFSSSETSPAYGISSSGKQEILVLKDYSETEKSASFLFNDGTKLTFELTSTDEDAELSLLCKMSKHYAEISVPYSFSNSYAIENLSSNHALVTSKSNFYMLNAHNISEDRILLSKSENIAKFQNYDPSKAFTYQAVAGFENTDKESFALISKQLRESLVSKMQELLALENTDSLSEAEITAYVAEMILNGKYNEALDSIPESFKRGNKRTYLSTPYFNNLANMNKSLVMQTSRYESMTENALTSKNLDIFTAGGISDFILRQKKTSQIKELLLLPSTLIQSGEFKPNAIQAAGILNVYADLYKADSNLASNFDSAIQTCLDVLEDNCVLEGTALSIQSETQNISLEQTVTAGNALVKAGTVLNRTELVSSGYLIMNSALKAKTPELFELAELYPLLAEDNKFYPHTEILGYYGNKCVWAWTCASSINYEIDSENIVNINIDFPLSYTHHIIFNGIPTFHSQIEIQRQMFRTDPRFETYNSSGYVYQSQDETLLIKSRHKSKIELIRLFCDPADNFSKQ